MCSWWWWDIRFNNNIDKNGSNNQTGFRMTMLVIDNEENIDNSDRYWIGILIKWGTPKSPKVLVLLILNVVLWKKVLQLRETQFGFNHQFCQGYIGSGHLPSPSCISQHDIHHVTCTAGREMRDTTSKVNMWFTSHAVSNINQPPVFTAKSGNTTNNDNVNSKPGHARPTLWAPHSFGNWETGKLEMLPSKYENISIHRPIDCSLASWGTRRLPDGPAFTMIPSILAVSAPLPRMVPLGFGAGDGMATR